MYKKNIYSTRKFNKDNKDYKQELDLLLTHGVNVHQITLPNIMNCTYIPYIVFRSMYIAAYD